MTDRPREPMLSAEEAERLASDFRPAWELEDAAIEEVTHVQEAAHLAELAMAGRAAHVVQTASFEPMHRPAVEVVVPIGEPGSSSVSSLGSTMVDENAPPEPIASVVPNKLIGRAPEPTSKRPPAHDLAPSAPSHSAAPPDRAKPLNEWSQPRSNPPEAHPPKQIVPSRSGPPVAKVVSTRPLDIAVARPRSLRPQITEHPPEPSSGRGRVVGTVVALVAVGLAFGVWLGVRGDDTPPKPKDTTAKTATGPGVTTATIESVAVAPPHVIPTAMPAVPAPKEPPATMAPAAPKPVVARPLPTPKPVATAATKPIPRPATDPAAKPTTKPAAGGIVRDDPF